MSGASVFVRGAWLELGALAQAVSGTLVTGRADLRLSGVSIDTRTLAAGELFVAVAGPRFDGHDFLAGAVANGAVAAVVHRDVVAPPGLAIVRVADTTAALGDLARELRLAAEVPVVGVTGSAGKTTTKDMAATLLATRGPVLRTEGNLNNRYGVPLTLFRLRPEHTAVVLEMGMSAPGELGALARIGLPDVAIITLVAPVHLEFFDSLEAIARAKAEILEGLRPGGVAVLNRDDPHVRAIGEAHRGEVIWFGRDRACDVSAERVRGTIHGLRFELRLGGRSHDVALPLPGPHFVLNFLAAAAAAHRLGISPEAIVEAASGLRAASHRGQVLRLGSGVTLLDDSYNSNPAAVEAAATALGMAAIGRRVAFLGDMLELGPRSAEIHQQTGRAIGAGLDALYAAGPLAASFLAGAREAGLAEGELAAFADSQAAAEAAPSLVRPGDAVLVKGSRGARMERVVEALSAHFGVVEG
ncbi:MAG: UDP-N-acetylmuramoyl-tripeptide--D-alanyl-D-alanine ligase [Vicinamibacteria bacterium]